MASQPNIEFEAAKFLQKLIHDSKDEPDKLATKLYVILQHMKASGKENSLPYQVISRAMETVVNQHGFDMESLQQPPNPINNEAQIGHAINPHPAGGAPQDSNTTLRDNEMCQPPAGPSSVVPDTFPGSVPHRSAISTEHESPLSIDTKSANSTSYERRDSSSWEQQATQKDNRSSGKRKRPEFSASDAHNDNSQQQRNTHIDTADAKKGLMNRMDLPRPFPGTSSLEPSGGKGMVDSDYWRKKPPKDASINFTETSLQGHLSSKNPPEMPVGGAACSPSDMSMRSGNPRDAGKSPMLSAPAYIMPFKDHHLKQLRAQCLVFLAFRNGLMPKRPHLEIALGSALSKEGSSAEGVLSDPMDNKVKEMATNEPRSNPDIASQQGNVVSSQTERVLPASFVASTGLKTDMSKREGENGTPSVEKSVPYADPAVNDEERKLLLNTQRDVEVETRNHESRVPTFLPIQPNDFSSMKSSSNHDNGHPHSGAMNQESPVMGLTKQMSPETIRWATGGVHNEASRGPCSASVAQHDLLTRNENSANHSQGLGEIANQGHKYVDGNSSNPWKPRQGLNNEKQTIVPSRDSTTTMLLTHGSDADVNHMIGGNPPCYQPDKMYGPGETDKLSGGVPPPKYTTSEKWIMIQQKRRIVNEENWMQKQQKVNQRILVRYNKLKETVNSSEDISAKTKSVIELKKLQLLGLQRRLRSNIVNDFFKPITQEVDRLKAIKKHRIGRRMKHVERYEQRMKEERQKRIRERQKEFFSEVEFHRERLDDVFKFKRERWKGFNRYVKEFHKRKERVHREKIDRIQREKINLLKINDVEGYLRMVQDAKSDRVNKLLKETEKYLQKLSAKLQEAKSISKQFETDADENQSASLESSDIVAEAEDENDQAKHYKESNEKYYLMAHSIKETIPEQPTGLRGGKLREYQMNGLRWLVSLYNNHLNGILADEMGLGKTVQVISLICYLMETKNDRGPFLVVVPSSVLPGWESELNFWAPDVNKIIYSGPPEERRRLFKERIVHQKFNVLLTTYEYLMNKHDRPKLTKVQWRYIIIDEGHRIKNASCKLNADLKLYQSSHRLLLTGTPLQNNLEELWALLNFLLPNIFNSSEDFSQWFNKPFESNGDNSPDEALLSEEENLLIINRLHQVLRPFVLRRLKHKVENELPEKIERLVRCEASAYQKLLMKRVEDNLGSLGNSKARAVHNSVMELRNICNHPYISQLHSDEVDNLIPKHFLPPIVRLCGKLEMLDRLLPKLKATNHRVLLFSTMTRLLDVMEEYLAWKKYRYLRLDGHTSGLDRGALIDQFNRPDSPYFIFLLSIRAGGVGVNLQAADTVIIFDTDWNPQVDLQAQARAHRIGQKKDVLVLRLETVNTVEEQVRASAEHKLGVANQSITAGFFDNNTSAEDRREYLEALLRESKKEEAAPVLADDALNDLLARSELEIDVFESVDQERHEQEMATWKTLSMEQGTDDSHVIPRLPSRLVTEDDLIFFLEAMKAYEVSEMASDGGLKRKAGSSGSFDTQYYGRGKRSREVRSYEEQWTEEEFEKLCQTESADAHKIKDELKDPQQDPQLQQEASIVATKTEAGPTSQIQQAPLTLSVESSAPIKSIANTPVKRGRGRPRRIPLNSTSVQSPAKTIVDLPKVSNPLPSIVDALSDPAVTKDINSATHQADAGMTPKSDATSSMPPPNSGVQITPPGPSVAAQSKVQIPKGQGSGEPVRRRGRKPKTLTQPSEQSVKPSSLDGAASLTVLPVSAEQSKPMSELKGSVAERFAVSSALPIVSEIIQDVGADSATADTPSDPHAPETQKLQCGKEVTAVVEPSPCTSAGPGAREISVTDVSGTPIVSAAPGSSSTPYTSAKLPGKRQRRKSQIGPESAAAGPVTSETATSEISLSTTHGSDIMPGRRQTRRSLGRGKGQSLAATTPVVTSTEQPKPSDSNLSLPISVPQTGISVLALPEAENLGVGSQVVDIPVHTPGPGSGYAQGSSVSQNSTLSLHNVSSASAIPSAGETAPRRRGRKKGWSANSVGKALTSGAQQKGFNEIKKTSGEDSRVIQTPTLVANVTTIEDHSGLSSHVKPDELGVVASSLEKSGLEAKNIDRGLEVNNASISKEVGMSSSVADVTPPSTTVPCQTTRYIVLALKSSARAEEIPNLTPETVIRKNEDSKADINEEGCKVRQPEVNVATNAGSTGHLDEDMNAPPGFDTPHAYTADTTPIRMSLPNEDNTDKKDALAANKAITQIDSRPTVDSDKNMINPGQVLEEDSAPPGFDNDDVSGLKPRVAGSLNCERRDPSDASIAKAQDSEHPPMLTEASDEIVQDSKDHAEKDLVPPGFSVTQAHLEEDGSQKVVSGEAAVVPSETRATGGLWQVQTTAEGPTNQSSNQEATETLQLLQTETFVGDARGERSGNESPGDGATIVQALKGHVHKETGISDLSVLSEKSDPSSGTDIGGTKVSTEEEMGKMDTLQRPDVESSSIDGIQTQDRGDIFIRDSKEAGGHLKELHVASEVHISDCGGAPVISDPNICEQGTDNKENLMTCVAESGQAAADTSTDGLNLVPTGNIASTDRLSLVPTGNIEDDSSSVPDCGFNSILASKDKEEHHDGQDDSAHPQATCASPGTEEQEDKIHKMDVEIPSDADCGVVDGSQFGSLNCERRDSSDASFAQAQRLTEASDEIVQDSKDLAEKDLVRPGFAVTPGHLEEDGTQKIVSDEAGVGTSESRAFGELWQVQPTAEDPINQSSNQEATETLQVLQIETFVGDACGDKCGIESTIDDAIIDQEVKGHVHKETGISDLSVHSEKSDPSCDTNNGGTKVSTEEKMGEMDTLQRPDVESSSRDGIQTQDNGDICIRGSKEEADHLKELDTASEAHISDCGGAPVISDPENCEQGSNNKENLIASVAESGQAAADTSTDGLNLAPTGNIALYNEKKGEDDLPCVPDCGFNSNLASKDKEEQHEGQDDNAHPQATCATPGTEAQEDKSQKMDAEIPSDADCGVVDAAGSLNGERRDSSDASFASAQDSENPAMLTEAYDEIIHDSKDLAEKDLVPPGFGVTQAHLEEDGSQNLVSDEAGVGTSESRAYGELWQVQTTAKDPINQSSTQEATETLQVLQVETFVGDAGREKCGIESCVDGAIIDQEVKVHVHKETGISDHSVHSEKSDLSFDTNSGGTKVSTEENMVKMDTVQRPDVESSPRDEIQTQDSGDNFIRGSKEEGDHIKELQLDSEAHISGCGGAPVVSDPEICEQGSNNKENLMTCVAESGQGASDTSTDGLNLVLTGNIALYSAEKVEDDSSCVPVRGFNSNLASRDKEEQNEGQDVSAHPQVTLASPGTEEQKDKIDSQIPSDVDCGVVNGGHGDGAHPQTTCASPGTEEQIDKMDAEIPSDADCGVVDGRHGVGAHPQTCASPDIEAHMDKMDAAMPSDADCVVMDGQDDTAQPQATSTQMDEMDTEIPSDADCKIVDGKHDDGAHPQTTCASSDTAAQMNEMDYEMHHAADCGVHHKIDASQNTELHEESVGHTIREIEEQDDGANLQPTCDKAGHESIPDDSANLQPTCDNSDTEIQKNKIDPEIPSDANCEDVNEGQDDNAHPQTTCASSDTEAPNKLDSEMPSDAECRLVNNEIVFSQNTELLEEPIGHTIEEFKGHDSSLCPVSIPKNEADHDSILNDSDNLQATCVSSDTEAQKDKIDLEIPSDANCGAVNKGQADSTPPKTICSSSCTEAQKNKMDSQMPSDADCGVVSNKIDFSQNTELPDESKGHNIQDIEEQDTFLGPVATQKERSDPEIQPDVHLCDQENRIETGLREETKEPNAQEISTHLEATSTISVYVIQEGEVDSETPPLAELSAPETKTEIHEPKELAILETEQQDVSESPVASELEAHRTISGPEVEKDDANALSAREIECKETSNGKTLFNSNMQASNVEIDDSKPCDDPNELHEQELAVEAETMPTDISSEINGQEMLVDECGQASSEIENIGSEMKRQEMLVEECPQESSEIENISSEIEGQEMRVDACRQASSEIENISSEIKGQEMLVDECPQASSEIENISSEIKGQEMLVDECPQASSEIGKISSEIKGQECEDRAGKETVSQVNKEAGCINSETEIEVETNSEKPADAETGTSNKETALGFQPEAAAITQAKECDDQVGKGTLVDTCIQASTETGGFQECEDHAGEEIVSEVNEAGCSN